MLDLQKIFYQLESISTILKMEQAHHIFIVCGQHIRNSAWKKTLEQMCEKTTFFTEFTSNPKCEEVLSGLHKIQEGNCDFILSIGGGSVIDVAKCIKKDYPVKHLAIPTTAGTGSEATHFAVLYEKGEKKSVAAKELLPEYVILEAHLLRGLSLYQKKSTMLDALCQCIESYWSLAANAWSRAYAKKGIELIWNNYEAYLADDVQTYKTMLEAAHYSGKAIQITTTTAPHAMSYKLTTLYGISHGHAVGLCLPFVWEYMYEQLENKKKNTEGLKETFLELAHIFSCQNIGETIEKLKAFYQALDLQKPDIQQADIDVFVQTINVERLQNNPMELTSVDLKRIYQKIWGG